MAAIRAFIAVELPDDIKGELAGLIDRLRRGRERAVKWVVPDGIHLTLKFLGNIQSEQVDDIVIAVERAAGNAAPVMLQLDRLGGFPNMRSPRVAWVGLSGDTAAIIGLQQEIERSLVPLGFALENREFAPHLTLGRVRERATHKERADLGRALTATPVLRRAAFGVTAITLMQSTLTPAGAVYGRLARITLDKADSSMLN